MFQLIYASTAARRLEKPDLHELVERARERNDAHGITGVLVYRNGSFLHVLEGAEADVRALYARIQEDERHRWVTLLKATDIAQRDFPDAPLAFRDRSVAGVRQQPLEEGERDNEARGPHAFGGGAGAHETLLQFQRVSETELPEDPGDAPSPSPEHGSASEAAAS